MRLDSSPGSPDHPGVGRGLCPSRLGTGRDRWQHRQVVMPSALLSGEGAQGRQWARLVRAEGHMGRHASWWPAAFVPWCGGGLRLRPAARGCQDPAEPTRPAWGLWPVRHHPRSQARIVAIFFSFFFSFTKFLYKHIFILSSFKHIVQWLCIRVAGKTVTPTAPSLLGVSGFRFHVSRARGGGAEGQRAWVLGGCWRGCWVGAGVRPAQPGGSAAPAPPAALKRQSQDDLTARKTLD